MHIHLFNGCLIASWVLTGVGLFMLSPALGLLGAGVLLVLYVLLAMRVSGGLYAPDQPEAKDQG
jgi:hypothetical protein